MSMKLKLGRLAKLATFATVLGGMTLAASSASATPTPFTWKPSGSSPSLSTAGSFTADSFSLSDFAHIHIGSTGAFTETGILQIGQFKLGAGTVTTPGLNGTSGATSYRMYATFSGSGSIGGWSGCAGSGFCFGSFSSLTYDLWGDK